MDNLQYLRRIAYVQRTCNICFKPYYKWITFNTKEKVNKAMAKSVYGFKPYYKWITFNTLVLLEGGKDISDGVLNLIING